MTSKPFQILEVLVMFGSMISIAGISSQQTGDNAQRVQSWTSLIINARMSHVNIRNFFTRQKRRQAFYSSCRGRVHGTDRFSERIEVDFYAQEVRQQLASLAQKR